LVKLPIEGGSAIALAKVAGNYPHWGTDDYIVISSPTVPIVRVRADGSGVDTIESTRGAQRFSWLMPGGSAVLFSRGNGIFASRMNGDSSVQVLPQGAYPTYVSTGHLLYISPEGGLFAAPFDADQLKVTGPSIRVVDGLGATVTQRGFSVSNAGTLLYRAGPSAVFSGAGSPMELFTGDLSTHKIETIRLPRGRRGQPRFSPDGRQIAFEWLREGGTETDIATFDLMTGTTTRLTFAGDNDDPQWSKDGKRIAFTKTNPPNEEDIFVKSADNSSEEQLLVSRPGRQNPTQWLSLDTILVQSESTQQFDLFVYSVSASKLSPYLQGPWAENDFHVSRDGKLAAFVSVESGVSNIWIRDFPEPKGKWQVSVNGGLMPRWSPDGKDLYYWVPGVPDSLYRVRVDRTPSVRVNTPQFVLSVDLVPPEGWDIHPDGKRFVATRTEAAAQTAADVPLAQHYVAIPDWFVELKAKTAGAKR